DDEHPLGYVLRTVLQSTQVQPEHDDTHGFRGVLHTVTDGHGTRGDGLCDTETFAESARVPIAEYPHDRGHDDETEHDTDDGRKHHRDDHTRQNTVPQHLVATDEGGTDQT